MPTPLTTRERTHLKARAHALEPVVTVGHAGVTPEPLTTRNLTRSSQVSGPASDLGRQLRRTDARELVKEVDRALTAHELIKVRVGTAERDARQALGDELASATQAAVVQRVGKVLILWRPRPQDPAVSPPS